MMQPAHTPLVQISLLPHTVPLGAVDQVVVEVAGAQTWHGSAGFTAPGA